MSARVRSATRSSRLSERVGAAPPSRPRDRPLPVARCARRPRRWREHRAHRSCGRYRWRAPSPVPKAWAARPPHTRRPTPTLLPGAYRGRQSSQPPNGARGNVSPSVRGLSSRCGSAGRWHARGARLRLRRPQRRLPRRFVGIDPDQDLHAHLRFGRTSAIGARRTFRLRAVHTPLLSH